MDVDAFTLTHQQTWDRLARLVRRAGRPGGLAPEQVDELVEVYQQVATDLAVVQSAAPDPALVARLSGLVARARAVISGAPASARGVVARYLAVDFPVTIWRGRFWVVGTALAWVGLAFAVGAWVAGDPSIQASLATPAEIRELTSREFEDYYSSAPAVSFAAQVWTNNAWVVAACLALGVLAGLPVLGVLAVNAVNVGVTGGFMAAAGRADVFFGLILPHGLLELTAVFIAGGLGLRLGWTVIDPHGQPRAVALAAAGRAIVSAVLGLAGVLAVSGVVEAFVTPSGLATWARIGLGALVWLVFVGYVGVAGRRAERSGATGDLSPWEAGAARDISLPAPPATGVPQL